LVDEAASRVRIKSMSESTDFGGFEDLAKELELIKKEKEVAVDHQEFERAAFLRDKEKDLKTRKKTTSKGTKTLPKLGERVTEEEIAHIVSTWTGIPVIKLTEEESAKLLRMEDALHKRVIGQDEAIQAVSRAIRRTRAGLKDPRRPAGSFVFLGPSGVGKTELARTLAEYLFGDEDMLIQIDMSEYMEKHTVSRLIGSPPGYVGFEEGGQLTEAVRRKPYSVVLFDEIEKAHPEVFNVLLQILEDGRLTDAQGRSVDFKNTILIMTSNIGARYIQKATPIGFSSREKDGESISYKDMKEKVVGELKTTFRPEFLNRIDDVIVFHELTKDEIKEIVDLLFARVITQVAGKEMEIMLTDKARVLLAKEGYNPTLGARPLRRAIQRLVEDPLSEAILSGQFKPGQRIVVDEKQGKIIFREAEGEKVTSSPASDEA